MGRITLTVAAVLNAPPHDVYTTIADYQDGHPNILPKGNLYDLHVEQGGYGAGTIIRYKIKTLGVEQAAHQRVSEPDPGRVLVEQDIESARNTMTTFRVTPRDQGKQTRVEICTTMNGSPGFTGLVEKLLVPIVLRSVFHKELRLLEAVARTRSAPDEPIAR